MIIPGVILRGSRLLRLILKALIYNRPRRSGLPFSHPFRLLSLDRLYELSAYFATALDAFPFASASCLFIL